MRNHFLSGLVIAALALNSLIQCAGGIGLISTSYAAEPDHAPQISDKREIKITATLRTIQNDAKTWDVEVVMETHTKALNDDMSRSAVLFADGQQLMPLSWQGAPLGGHHRKGLLSFKASPQPPGTMELHIRLTGDPVPRSFKWRLK